METCQRCGIEADLRHLIIDCAYPMESLCIPFQEIENIQYKLIICIHCRSELLKLLEYWFNNIEPKKKVNSGIFIREYGATREITKEEYHLIRIKQKESQL